MHTSKILFALGVMAVVGASACTTTVFSSGTTSSTSSGGNGGSGAGTTTSTASGGGDVCGGYEDTTEAHPVELTITNTTDAVIYLTASDCEVTPYPALADGDGTPLRYRSPGNCGYTCSQLQDSPPICTADACAAPPVIGIEPGGSYTTGTWDGTLLDETTMPLVCHFEPLDERQECEQRVPAPSGDYELSVDLFDDVSCFDGPCDCTFVDGVCTIEFEGIVEGEARTATAAVQLPADATVELIVE